MKVFSTTVSLLVTIAISGIVTVVNGHEEAECDCNGKIEEATRNIIAERDMHHGDVRILLGQRDELTQTRDELVVIRDNLTRERDELVNVKVQLENDLVHQKGLLAEAEMIKFDNAKEIEKLKADVAKGLEDREHFRQVAQENQHYMQEYKVRLATIRDKSAKLDLELETAYSKIRELEQATLVTKLKKELGAGYDAFLQLIGKQKGMADDPSTDL